MLGSPKFYVDVLSPFFATKRGSNTFSGGLFPSSDGSLYDIGKQFMPWDNGYFNNLFAGDNDVGLAIAATVLAGVGLTSDEVQFFDGSPTLSMGTPGTLDKDTINEATNTPDQHTHAIVEYSDGSTETGTADDLVSTDANGQLKVSRSVAHEYFEGPIWQSLDSVSEDISAQPTGDIYLNPGGYYVLPGTSADTTVTINIGDYNAAFLEVYAAKGLFGVLPSDGMQTGIAGTFRSTGAGVTFLTRDILGAETTVIYVLSQAFETDEWAILHANVLVDSVMTEQIEVVKFDDNGSLQGAGDYQYTVTRAEYGEVGDVVSGGGASFDENNDFDTWYYDFQPNNNPFLPGLMGGGGASVGGWFAGNAVISLGKDVGAGLIEWTSQDYVDGGAGPGFVGWRRTGTAAWDDLVPFFMVGNPNGYGDYTSDVMAAGMGVDLTIDPETSTFEGIWVDTTQARGTNIQSLWYLSTAKIASILSTGVKIGIDVSADATTGFQFDSTTGDFVYGELANDYVRWDHSGNVMDIFGLLTGSRFTYLKALDIASASVPNGEVDGVNIFYDNTLDHVIAKDEAGAYRWLDVTELNMLTDVIIAGAAENDSFFFDGATWVNGAGHKLNVGTETTLTIATGIIDISTVGNNGLIDLRGEGSVDDSLVTISGGNIGDVIYLIVADPTTYGQITVLNTGNINLPNSLYLNSTSESAFLMLTTAGWNPILHTPTTYMDFNLIGTDVHREGRVHWDAVDGTLSVGMPGGNVELQLGQEMLIRCRNESGVQIDNGTVVYASGASGNKPLLGLADSTDPTKLAVLGMATEDIAHNDNGYVNAAGFVRDVNTLGMTIGLPVFLDEATPGGFTQTRPTAPNYIWILGIVIAAHATEGVVYNSPTPGHVLMSMSDVFTEVPADGEILIWNDSNSRFELGAQTGGGGGGATTLDELTDVTIDGTPADDELLAFDTSSGDWLNQTAAEAGLAVSGHTHTVDDLSDAVITGTPADNEVFAYDIGSGDWINQTAAEAGLSTVDELADLSDVDGTAPNDGQVLTWDNINGWWEPDDLPTPVPATVTVPQSFEVYIDVKERLAEYRIHGDLPDALTTGDTLDSIPTDIDLTTGLSKLVIIVNAGSDIDGDVLVTGTSVDRDTKAETGADTETITVDALTTDTSSTDSNGNVTHAFSGAYITSKWWKGAVTLSTADLTLTDVDVYQVSFEQFGDNENITVQTLDIITEVTNTLAWADVYMYALEVTDSKCEVTVIGSVHLSVGDSEADRYYRLRHSNIGKALDGTTDGIWVNAHFGPIVQNYWEDITIKVWYDIDLSVAGDTLVASGGTEIWMPDFPPETPTVYDDEFGDGVVDAMWTETDPSGEITITEDEAGLRMQMVISSGADVGGIYQDIPVGDFSIITKVSLIGEDESTTVTGLALWEDGATSVDEIATFGITYNTGGSEYEAIRWTTFDTFGSAYYSGSSIEERNTDSYIRVRRNGTTYSFEVSSKGLGWMLLWEGALGFVPQHMGVALTSGATSGPASVYSRFQFFRYVSSDVGTYGLLEGQRVVAQAQALPATTATEVMDLLHSVKGTADTPDDEFDGAVLDPKWTVVSGSSGTIDFEESGASVEKYELITAYNQLYMQVGHAGTEEVSLRQDFTLADGDSIVVAMSPSIHWDGTSGPTNNEIQLGVSLNDDDGGYAAGNYINFYADTDAGDFLYKAYNGAVFGTMVGEHHPHLSFFRINRNGLVYSLFLSFDGLSWYYMGSDTAGSAYDNLWIFAICAASQLEPPVPIQVVHWVRQGSQDIYPWDPRIIIQAAVAGVHNLVDHGDVTLDNPPADNEILGYDTSTNEWINQTAAELGLSTDGHSHDLDGDLDDVVIGSEIDNDLLAYNLATGKWINQSASEAGLAASGHTHVLDDLTDVVITGVTDDELLAWNGSQWINQTAAEAGLSEPGHLHLLDGDLTDVNIITVAEDDILAWDDVAGEWQNQSAAEAGLAVSGHIHGEPDLDDLGDVTITTPADNEVLAYDGVSDFINQTAAEAGLATAGHSHTAPALDDLTDVTITTPAAGHNLVRNGSGWVNQRGNRINVGTAVPVTLVSDVATISGSPNSSYFDIRGQSGSPDDLATITGGNNGDVILIYASVEDITVKNGTGNIDCDGDTVMNAADNIMTLVLNGSTWYQVAFTSGS